MSDIQLFKFNPANPLQTANELQGRSALIEKQLQNLLEAQLEVMLGIRFLATEYITGKNHRGRIDTLGIDENNCPVIIEYKRHSTEDVVSQGLFYLDWLLDHRADFKLLVLEKLGADVAQSIEWAGTRLLCIAADFTRYSEHAVAQIDRNIELIRYKLFDEDLILLELVNATTQSANSKSAKAMTTVIEEEAHEKVAGSKSKDKTFEEQKLLASPELLSVYEQLVSYIHSLGDDVQEKSLKLYTAFRRLRNFTCVGIVPKQDPKIWLTLKLNPDNSELEKDFSRDIRAIGHWGTGDLEVTIRNAADLKKALPLIERAYQEN